MKAEWRVRKTGMMDIVILTKGETYPLARATILHSGGHLCIEAVAGLLKNPDSTCDRCTCENPHSLAYGPVDEKNFYTGHEISRNKLKLNHFGLEDMRAIVLKELGFDVGIPPIQ